MLVDDEPRWLVTLISDTGICLAEAYSDIQINDTVPHLVIREHPWRQPKISSSSRELPLVGAALWAAKRITVQRDQFAAVISLGLANNGKYNTAKSASDPLRVGNFARATCSDDTLGDGMYRQ